VTFIRRDGTPVHAGLCGTPIFDPDGNFKGSFGVGIDITERKRAEEDRDLNAQRLEALIRLGDMGEADLGELAAFAMEEAVRLTGSSIGYVAFADEDEEVLTMHAWSQEAMRGCSMEETPLRYLVKETGLWGEAVRQRRPVITNDYSVPNPAKKGYPKGHVEILRHMNVPILDDGRIVIVAGVGNKRTDYDENDVRQLRLLMEGVRRIVRRKSAEEKLQESEERFRLAFQTSPDAVNINRMSDGLYVDVNSGFTELTGYTRDEVLGKTYEEVSIWHGPKDRLRLVDALRETGHVRNLEAKFRLKDGTARTGLMSARIVALNGEDHILSVTRDVEDWKKAEAALAESEAKYKDLFENSTDLIYTHDLEGSFISVNEAFSRLLGYDAEECLKLGVMGLIDHAGLPITVEYPSLINKSGWEGSGSYETAVRAKDGRLVWLEVNSRLLRKEGKVVGVHGTARDVTARKEADVERARLYAAVEQAGESVILTNAKGSILYVNPAFEEITGYAKDEVLGKNPKILGSEKHNKAFYDEMWAVLQKGEVWRGRLTNKKKDGTVFEETATISAVRDRQGRTVNYVIVGRDVTTEIMLQRQLLHAQKMEAVGTLAGGIAHDFNNLLQAILGCTDLLLICGNASDPDVQKLEIIRKAARDGAELVSRILTFSRKTEPKTRPMDLNEEIRKVERLLRRTMAKMIDVRPILADGLRIIEADPVQIEQVLINLAVNAQQAMPYGGELIIETSNISMTDELPRTALNAKPGKYVLLTVSDTGIGMEPGLMDRIFEPFFTTKADGEGTGLGLAMVHGIVSQLGGCIACDSEPGTGTSFRIYFPAAGSSIIEDLAVTGEMPAFGTETVLLVDDDDRVREIGRQMIRMGGYRVLTAHGGEAALEIYSGFADEISIVVLDMIMPGMGGKRCLEELLRINAKVKVLVASGYPQNGPLSDKAGKGACGFISKPYDGKAILGAIRKVLNQGTL
ncbi:MAG: PAS domain S-box protein, partial [Pseudomonadota bacterium]